MNISSLKSFSIPKVNNICCQKRLPVSFSSSDVFISTIPKVGNKDFDSFLEFVSKTNFLNDIVDIVENKGKILGKGYEGVTYAIPENDNWVIKEYKRSNFLPIKNTEPKIIKVNDISPDLNIGQAIAKVEIPRGKNYSSVYYILKKQEGESLGVGFEGHNDVDNLTIPIYIDSLKKVANMPLSSYDKLVKDVNYITNIGYEIDTTNPNNLMFDDKTQTINFVDINDKHNKSISQFGNVLFSLLGGFYYLKFDNSNVPTLEEKTNAQELSQQIFEKFMTSMKNNGYKFDYSYVFSDLLDTNKFDKIVGIGNIDAKFMNLHKMGLY